MPRYKFDSIPVDPDPMPRPVMAIGFDIAASSRGTDLVAHDHPMAQMIYMARGVLSCEMSRGLWIVPPGCAIWIPGGIRHDVKGFGTLEVYSLLVDPASAPTMPEACCTVSVSPLLRELLLRCAGFAAQYPADGTESRLASVLLDELAAAPVEKLHLPMPADSRLRRIADAMAAEPSTAVHGRMTHVGQDLSCRAARIGRINPAVQSWVVCNANVNRCNRASVNEWASRIEVSERTLSRLVLQETGMSFGRWRQQLHISLALQWLSQGTSVQSVATDLGYESASSFGFMFRKVLGTSPARYMTQWQAGSPNGADKAPG